MRFLAFCPIAAVCTFAIPATGQELQPIPMTPPVVSPPDSFAPGRLPNQDPMREGLPEHPFSAMSADSVEKSGDALRVPAATRPPLVSPPVESQPLDDPRAAFKEGEDGKTEYGGTPAQSSEEISVDSNRRLAEGLLEEALKAAIPIGAGSPLTLRDALANVYDARRQLAVVDAYWSTSAALGNLFIRRQVRSRLDAIVPRGDDAAILRSARAAASASLREAELLVQEARYELAERVGLIPGGDLPLPSDKPHVGTYRTNADWILSSTSVLSRARLIDRVLPVRRQSIEDRAAAVAQAASALDAASAAYTRGETSIDTFLAFLRQYSNQYRAFFGSVNEYNHQIVEYVVTVMPGPVPAGQMVTMLIKPAYQPSGFRRDPDVSQAGATESPPETAWKSQTVPEQAPPRTAPPATHDPFPDSNRTSGSLPPPPPRENQVPTLAPPPQVPSPARPNWPTLAPKRETSSPDAFRENPGPGSGDLDAEHPVERPPSSSSVPSEPLDVSPRSAPALMDAVLPESSDPGDYTAPTDGTAPQRDSGGTAGVGTAGTLHTAARPIAEESNYAGLADLEPLNRAIQLAEILHWDHDPPTDRGSSITLAECLRRNLNPNRLELIRAYWIARRYAAEEQLLVREIGLLENLLATSAGTGLNDPGGCRLTTDLLAARAALGEARVARYLAQFHLTSLDGQRVTAEWLYPATPPAVAPPISGLSMAFPTEGAFPRDFPAPVQAWSTGNRARQRLTDLVATRYAELLERADAVVEADIASAQRWAEYRDGVTSLERALDIHRCQMEATFDFLAALSAYNVERAQALLERFPQNGSTEQLVRELGCN